MDNPNRFTDDDRAAILKCLGEEQALKAERKPYRESVIVACEIILRLHPVDLLPACQWGDEITASDMLSQQRAKDIFAEHANQRPPRPNYWWQNYD